MRRASVDLPQPDGPITHISSRRWTWNDTLSSASVVGRPGAVNVFDSPCTSRITGRSFSRVKRAATSGACSR